MLITSRCWRSDCWLTGGSWRRLSRDSGSLHASLARPRSRADPSSWKESLFFRNVISHLSRNKHCLTPELTGTNATLYRSAPLLHYCELQSWYRQYVPMIPCLLPDWGKTSKNHYFILASPPPLALAPRAAYTCIHF